MNAQTAKDYLPLVQALADGKQLEVCIAGSWMPATKPSFDQPAQNYRIKPDPRKWMVVVDRLTKIPTAVYSQEEWSSGHACDYGKWEIVETVEVIK